ncbi:hypothetical protein E1176_03910 [Fulvivirga sp. RKSG066]|uniref:hypothetical protein n=1 Tax=Fulvivirga aurantia TaxID=2529383 RepID=UPI0012BD365D|nr:hypothetical protein [Fulvivirga aurantia]MTI20155.1 hypothetical protein [Fulvivirga aurantia]
MKKDIEIPKVENVTVAVAHSINEAGGEEWRVHLINNNEYDLENTLVTSKGYGKKEGETQKTSTLRHFLETVKANDTAAIETLDPAVFHLNNEYWVTYYVDGTMYDKRFTFLPDSIQNSNLTFIEALGSEGILHS